MLLSFKHVLGIVCSHFNQKLDFIFHKSVLGKMNKVQNIKLFQDINLICFLLVSLSALNSDHLILKEFLEGIQAM